MISLFIAPPLPVAVLTPACPCSPAWAPRQRLRQADPEIIDKHSLGLEPAKLPATPADFSLASIIFLDDSMFRSLSGRDQRLLVTFFFWFYASVVLKDPHTNRAERLGSQRLQLSLLPPVVPSYFQPVPKEHWAGLASLLRFAQACVGPARCPAGSGLLDPHVPDPCSVRRTLCSRRLSPRGVRVGKDAGPRAEQGKEPAWAWQPEQDIPLPSQEGPRHRGARLSALLAACPPQRAKINSSISHGQFPPDQRHFAGAVRCAQHTRRIQMPAVRWVSGSCSFWSWEHFSLC